MNEREELPIDEVTLADFIYSVRGYGDAVAKAKLLWPMLSVAQGTVNPADRVLSDPVIVHLRECSFQSAAKFESVLRAAIDRALSTPSTGLPAPAPHAEVQEITEEMVLAGAKAANPFAWEKDDDDGDYLVGDIARESTIAEVRQILTAALALPQSTERGGAAVKKQDWLFNDADAVAKRAGELDAARAFLREKPSTSYLQRKMLITYNHAMRLMETLENEGFISQPDSAGRRSVLVSTDRGGK